MVAMYWYRFSEIVFLILFWYFLIINSFYAVLICLSVPGIFRRYREVALEDVTDLIQSDSLPLISVIIPAYNEEVNILNTVQSILALSYPSKEVIVVSDGSTDRTLDILKEEYELEAVFPFQPEVLKTKSVKSLFRSKVVSDLLVIDKENGKTKSDANNCGLNFARGQYFVVIDADTVLEKDALLRMVRPFFTHPGTICQGGTIRILNGCTVEEGRVVKYDLPKGWLPNVQVPEYLRAFLYGRLGWNYLGGALIISGAFGMFDRKAVVEMGGYQTLSAGEDVEITLRINAFQRQKGEKDAVMFVPDPVAWTEVPSTWKELSKQRARWHQGLVESIIKFRSMLFNPRYGKTGLIGFPYLYLAEMFEPFFELAGLVFIVVGMMLGQYGMYLALLLFAVALGLTATLSMLSTVLEVATFRRYQRASQFVKLFFYSIVEHFGVRQMSIWWRLVGFWNYLIGVKRW